jgi:type I restriction enzyme S subunit
MRWAVSDLPVGWTETTLGEIASQGQYGWTSRAAENGRVKYLRTTDITSGHLNWDTVPYCQDNPPNVEKYKIEPGDILISRAGSVGFSALIEDVPSTPAVFASYLIRYIPNSQVNPKFIARFLQSPNYWQQISDASAGIALANVNAKKLANVILPLPPLDEQKRIAEKLDSLLARVDSCQTHLERVPQILKRFRQSVLAAATSGRLTEDWREENDVESEWATQKISEITSKVGSGATPNGGEKSYKVSGIPLIRSMNVVFYGFKRKGLAYLDEKQAYELRGAEVKARDVLLNITGASIGRVTLAPSDLDGARVNQHVCIIRPTETILPEFLCHYLSAPEIQRMIGAENYGVTRQALTKEQILNFEIPIPSLEEQAEIVRRVERLFDYAERLEARYTSASEHVERLTPSLLGKAFRGELVRQE